MDAWVYHSQPRTTEAAAFVAQLRASGEYARVVPANSRYYEGEIHRAARVFHDGSSRRLVWEHEQAGIELTLWMQPTLNQEVTTSVPPAAAVEEVRQNGTWFAAFRDGVKVGTSKRSEAEAWAVLRGE